jgi:hypothetical protein
VPYAVGMAAIAWMKLSMAGLSHETLAPFPPVRGGLRLVRTDDGSGNDHHAAHTLPTAARARSPQDAAGAGSEDSLRRPRPHPSPLRTPPTHRAPRRRDSMTGFNHAPGGILQGRPRRPSSVLGCPIDRADVHHLPQSAGPDGIGGHAANLDYGCALGPRHGSARTARLQQPQGVDA